jgi:hypothetical protein
MIQIQVVPRTGVDAYALLRAKVLHEAATWYWSNKAHTRLRHVQSAGHIDVANAGGVLVARVRPKDPRDIFYLAEKFMGRLVAWFESELAAIHLLFLDDAAPPKRRKRAKGKSRG